MENLVFVQIFAVMLPPVNSQLELNVLKGSAAIIVHARLLAQSVVQEMENVMSVSSVQDPLMSAHQMSSE